MLLSGGVDSTATLALARAEGLVCHTLTFHYGQRHSVEVEAAERIAKSLGVASHTQCRIDLRAIGGSSLTGDIAVPKDRALPQINTGIPVTYVPARNTIFLAYALAVAEVTNSRQIFIGVNAIDYSGYPDCRPEFIAAFENLANLATKAAVEGSACRIRAPFLHHSKAEILRAGLDLGVDYSLTHSCYDPVPADGYPLGVRPCGRCDSCCLRRQAFQALGIPDPAC